MRIAYAKLGRSMQFDSKRQGFQGNAAVGNFIKRLARRNPEHEFWLVGKNDDLLDDAPSNIVNPWRGQRSSGWSQKKGEEVVYIPGFDDEMARQMGELDAVIMHLGQHGTTNRPIPKVPNTWAECDRDPSNLTNPFVWSRNYAGFLVEGMNAMGDRTDGQAPVVYLCEDPRNYHKARDIKWPTGTDNILAQYRFKKEQVHDRYRDHRTPESLGFKAERERGGELWRVQHVYDFGGLELMILPDNWDTWGQKTFEEREPAGIATTSVARYAGPEERRSWLTNEYLLKSFPGAPVFGKWDEGSLEDVPPNTVVQNNPADFPDLLGSWRVTLSLVAVTHSSKHGASWTVAKPFQCFAARTVVFQVGRIDDMGWILPTRRRTPGAKLVGTVHGTNLFSVRDDWTDDELLLARWTRVESPDEFDKAAKAVSSSKDLWTRLTDIQRGLLQRRWDEALTETLIEQRLGL